MITYITASQYHLPQHLQIQYYQVHVSNVNTLLLLLFYCVTAGSLVLSTALITPSLTASSPSSSNTIIPSSGYHLTHMLILICNPIRNKR